jgi:hypothetical protein
MGGYVGFNESTPYDMGMLSVIFNKPHTIVQHALDQFIRFGMIEITDRGFVYITNWEKHQSVDKMDKLREQARLRKQNERERKKLLPQALPNVTQCHADVTLGHATDIELDIDKEKELSNKVIVDAKASKRFIRPDIQDVIAYCQERKNNVDPEKWHDHYTSNGWKVGKNPMKDWKAAVRTWEKSSVSKPSGNNSKAERSKTVLQKAMEAALHEQGGNNTNTSGNFGSLPEFRGDR